MTLVLFYSLFISGAVCGGGPEQLLHNERALIIWLAHESNGRIIESWSSSSTGTCIPYRPPLWSLWRIFSLLFGVVIFSTFLRVYPAHGPKYIPQLKKNNVICSAKILYCNMRLWQSSNRRRYLNWATVYNFYCNNTSVRINKKGTINILKY